MKPNQTKATEDLYTAIEEAACPVEGGLKRFTLATVTAIGVGPDDQYVILQGSIDFPTKNQRQVIVACKREDQAVSESLLYDLSCIDAAFDRQAPPSGRFRVIVHAERGFDSTNGEYYIATRLFNEQLIEKKVQAVF